MRKSSARQDTKVKPSNISHSRTGAVFAELLFETFRLYSRINATGDILSEGTGLTSARWRVLGSVLPMAKSVAQVARERGLTRQSVQQIANSLVRDGFAKFEDNDRHKSSKLLTPTERGRKVVLGTIGEKEGVTISENELQQALIARALLLVKTLTFGNTL